MVNRTTRWSVLAAAVALLAAGLLPPATWAGAPGVTPADDAYHYRDWADGHHDVNYVEWWYFNLVDARQNLQAVFTYFVADPTNVAGIGLTQLTAIAYTPAGIVSLNDVYPPDAFQGSYDQADVQIEANRIEVIDADTYHIVGATRDGRLSWDLTYARQAPSWFAADRMVVGTRPWEQMSWLVYMPRAAVTGQLTVDGQTYTVAASGYHDHNWGEWVFTDALWNWAQYSEPGLSFELGDFIGGPAGLASLEVQGERTVFTKDQYRLVHTRWAYDRADRQPYPVESQFFAENATTRLRLTLSVTATDVLRGGYPPPLPLALIYEQTAEYTGRLWRKDPSGAWQLATSFQGGGFKEYTAKTRPRSGSTDSGGAPFPGRPD
jgi:hypothetical protein